VGAASAFVPALLGEVGEPLERSSLPRLSPGGEPRLYLIPGEQRYVGVSDGVDAFVAPVDINPFGVDVRKLIGEYLSTGKLPGPSTPRPRVRITSTGRHVEDAQIIIMTALEQQKLLRPRIKLER